MDHLGPSIRALGINIPVLDMSDYDGESFDTYPERQGWGSKTATEWCEIFKSAPREFQAFLQKWLFFGILSTVSKKKVLTPDFTQRGDAKLLKTESLPALLEDIVGRWRHGGGEDIPKIYEILYEINLMLLKSSSQEHDGLAALREQDPSRQISLKQCLDEFSVAKLMDSKILMSIHLMSEILMSMIGSHVLDPNGKPLVSFQGLSHARTSLPWTRLHDSGWCISELPVLFGQFNTSSLLSLNTLCAPKLFNFGPGKDLVPIRCGRLCNEFECSSRKLHDGSYRTRHIDGCVDCQDFIAEPVEILEEGFIPLVRTIDKEGKYHQVKLVSTKENHAYVAISHVWSDGLGNTKKNALPRCQLLRLSSLVAKLPYGSSAFDFLWLDTLCVPPDEAKQDKAQQRAIEKMRVTYENADAVLVLDSWLLSSNTRQRSDEEILTQIFASHWNRRLWTFQEGALAKVLYFQFADGAYDLDGGIQRLTNTRDLVLDTTLRPPILARNLSLRGFKQNSQNWPPQTKISSLFATCRYRQTSVASDEPVCLGALLGFSMGKILEASDTERMQTFWKMTSEVPRDFLFYEGETFDDEGLRWAPRTLLRSQSNVEGFEQSYTLLDVGRENHVPKAVRCSTGLRVSLSGLLFISTEISFESYLYLKDKDKVYRFSPSRPPRPSSCSTSSPYFYPEFGMVAFILNDEKPDIPKGMLNQGILAAVYPSENGDIYARKICNGYCETLTRTHHSHEIDRLPQIPLDRTVVPAQTRASIPAYATTLWRGEGQHWIVD